MSTFSISPSVSGKSTWDFAVDGPLTLSTAGTWTIVPSTNLSVPAKIWGGGGGSGEGGAGAGAGYANGSVTLASGTSYQLIVGGGGTGVGASTRTAGGGGAGSGIQFTSNSTAIIVAGGGGGAAGGATRQGGGGGGTSGSNGDSAGSGGGYGGTQSAAGAGGVGSRRTGNAGSGRNGGGGNTGTPTTAGGTGFGNGGAGTYNGADSGSGGGGGGYYGGGEGGGDAGGFGGGGGSGYLHPTLVLNGSMTNGSNNLYAGNYTDSNAGTSGQGGNGSSILNGNAGKIYLDLTVPGFVVAANTVFGGRNISITYNHSSSSSPVAYTITGVTSSDIGGNSLTGDITLSGQTGTLSIPTSAFSTGGNKTLTISAGGYSASVTITPTAYVRAASGGTQSTFSSGGKVYRAHTFNDSTSFTISNLDAGATANVLIVAAGGGGGGWGGGGGAGGVLTSGTVALSQQTYTITIGAGGARGTSAYTGGGNGANTTALGLTAIGGGGGGWYNGNNGLSGGSGGGGGMGESTGGTGGAGTTGQGFAGGTGSTNISSWGSSRGGGGGGAANTGTTGVVATAGSTNAGKGGDGLIWPAGGSTYYGGGGGGHGGTTAGRSIGGLGGGGAGGRYQAVGGDSGTINTGGGGGGSWGGAGELCGLGGSGIVIISYELEPGIITANSVPSGSNVDVTYIHSSNTGNVAYTITGVTSADINGTALTGNVAVANSQATLSIPTAAKIATTNILTLTLGAFTANVTITPGISARYLIVAGGGGGGSDMGGGGGAGGYLAGTGLSVTGLNTITIGAGGTGGPAGTSGPSGSNGANTTAFGLTAIGGGGGASVHNSASYNAGNGGSGGGGSGGRQSSGSYGGLPGTGTAGQGSNGAASGVTWYPGGGGGAGAAASQTGSQQADGGIGLVNDILGTSYYWAGGGAGAGYSVFGGNGGLGGGGGGAPRQGAGTTNGTGGGSALNSGSVAEIGTTVAQTNKKGGAAGVNTGGGGGGGSHYNLTNDGGAGGSGIVVVRYGGGQRATGGTITTVGSDTVHTFYSSGTLQAFSGGLTASANTLYWGDSVTITYADDQPNGTNVAYTITGVDSAQINGASVTGNFTITNSVSQLTLQTTQTSVTANTITVTAGGYTVNIAVSFLISFTGSVGSSWGANLTYTASTRGVSNNALIPYAISGSNVTSSQLANFPLTGTFTNIIASAPLGSNYFDGTGDYLTIPNGSAFQFGTGDFTVECWIKTTDAGFDIINQYSSGGSNWSWIIVSGSLYWQNSNAAASLYWIGLGSLPANPTSGSWTHIAITRTSGTLKYWINGVGTASTQGDSTNYVGGASVIRIGSGFYGDLQGNISNLRVVKGVAVYTANFTPSVTPLFATQSSGTGIAAITGTETSLLTCKSQSTLTDYSTNAFVVTGNGNVAANTEYPGTFTSAGGVTNIGTGTLIITTNTSEPILSSANGFVTVGGTTRSFTIRNPNPSILGARIVSTMNSVSFINTPTSDIYSANTESLTSNVSNIYSQLETSRYTTNPGNSVFISTIESDIHTQNIEAKTAVVSNTLNAVLEIARTSTTITTIIPTSTFAYSSGTEISANGNAIAATPTVTQTWYI